MRPDLIHRPSDGDLAPDRRRGYAISRPSGSDYGTPMYADRTKPARRRPFRRAVSGPRDERALLPPRVGTFTVRITLIFASQSAADRLGVWYPVALRTRHVPTRTLVPHPFFAATGPQQTDSEFGTPWRCGPATRQLGPWYPTLSLRLLARNKPTRSLVPLFGVPVTGDSDFRTTYTTRSDDGAFISGQPVDSGTFGWSSSRPSGSDYSTPYASRARPTQSLVPPYHFEIGQRCPGRGGPRSLTPRANGSFDRFAWAPSQIIESELYPGSSTGGRSARSLVSPRPSN